MSVDQLKQIRSLAELKETMPIRSGVNPRLHHNAERLQRMLDLWKGTGTDWAALEGATILDIGCGSENNKSFLNGADWLPFFCRIAASHGAKVYGLDGFYAGNDDLSTYTHIQGNFLKYIIGGNLYQIPQIEGVTFDLMNCYNVYGSNLSPEMEDSLWYARTSASNFHLGLLRQGRKYLNLNGILAADSQYYRKTAPNKLTRV